MYIARFSYNILPVNRQAALDFIRREVESARNKGLNARLLIPLTRSYGGAALQFEMDMEHLDQLDQFRHRAVGPGDDTGDWMHAFSQILLSPPTVEILKVSE
jgi:hypothetical protein